MAYLADKQEKMAQEANLHHEFSSEANMVRVLDHTLNQRLDCIYDDEPLGF